MRPGRFDRLAALDRIGEEKEDKDEYLQGVLTIEHTGPLQSDEDLVRYVGSGPQFEEKVIREPVDIQHHQEYSQ